MPALPDGLMGCYRCGYVWRLRKSPVRICPMCKSRYWDVPLTKPRRSHGRVRGMGLAEVIGDRGAALRALIAEYGGFEVRVFGSVARGEARKDSDVDLLVRFRRPVGILGREELRERASALLDREVDLATESNLHWLARPEILREARLL